MPLSNQAPTTSRRKTYTRRGLLAGGALLGCCALVSGGGATAWWFANRPVDHTGELDFSNALTIPPLVEGEIAADGTRRYDLVLQTGASQILPDKETETWGVNGPLLGPTLRMRRGETVKISVHNELPEATSVHWHGMHLPARMDGGPHQMIESGASWEPGWRVEQPAATLWYHPHPHGRTAEHVYKGVAGLILIDDEHSDDLELPHDYGVDDIPLIIQDRKFDDDGQLTMDSGSFFDEMSGRPAFGIVADTILVNGTWNPHLEIQRAQIRFRLLNGANARFFKIGFDDDRPFHLVATDNGLLPAGPEELRRLLLGPGERAEIVVQFEPGDRVVLRSFAADLGTSARAIGADDTFDVLQVRAADDFDDAIRRPEAWEGTAVPDLPEDARARTFRLEGHNRINGREMDMARIDEVIPAGALEVWEVSSDGLPHTFHIHGATFRVLEVNGAEPDAHLRGPKDTVFVGADHRVRLAVQFDEHTDSEMPYMFHCHLLRHEDNGMMGQFVVVEPGTELSVSRELPLDHH